MNNSFNARTELAVGDKLYQIYSCARLAPAFPIEKLPFAQKILLENLLRFEDGLNVTRDDIEALANWDAKAIPSKEIAFTPARVLMQDFTGVPAVVDLAAMRDAMTAMGGDPTKINPLSPAELVIDHSVQVDVFGSRTAADENARIEFDRNQERYGFLRWGQAAFSNFAVVPPDTGIVHQVNLEFLARTVFAAQTDGHWQAYPDTLVGTDSHTTMINGLGVLGWGVGGIEAEAAMLGQPITMLIPQVVGFKLSGALPEGATATDLVLRVTELLRKKGVVGKFVEFFRRRSRSSAAGRSRDPRQHGTRVWRHLRPLSDRRRDRELSEVVGSQRGTSGAGRSLRQGHRHVARQHHRRRRLLRHPRARHGLDRAESGRAQAPQDRIVLKDVKSVYRKQLAEDTSARAGGGTARASIAGKDVEIGDGAVVIAAITSCTNTSNPSVMIGAGLLARKATERGLSVKPWVKTSLAPGSLVVSAYLEKAGLTGPLEALGFHTVGYGCTTCIGNSGPLPVAVSEAIRAGDLVACSVLSGNRNFEGRVHAEVKMNFLASPPLVVAYAIAGTMDIDMTHDPLGQDANGRDVFLKDIWPTTTEIQQTVLATLDSQNVRRELCQRLRRRCALARHQGHRRQPVHLGRQLDLHQESALLCRYAAAARRDSAAGACARAGQTRGLDHD
jgi:aconitate hydratase